MKKSVLIAIIVGAVVLAGVVGGVLIGVSNANPLHVHTYDNDGEWTIVKEATCEEDGVLIRYCNQCSHTESQKIDALEHNVVTLQAVSATCTSTGLSEGKQCSICNKVFVAQETIDTLPHDFGEWTTVKESTMIEYGSEERECKCGKKESRSTDLKPPLTLKEIIINKEKYEWQFVVFEATVVECKNGLAYVQDYDPETNMYYGIGVDYQGNLRGQEMEIIATVGNRVKIVGCLSVSGNDYQITDIRYNIIDPDHPRNIQKIGENYPVVYNEFNAQTFESEVEIEIDNEKKIFEYADLARYNVISVKNIKVIETQKLAFYRFICQSEDGLLLEFMLNLKATEANELVGKSISFDGIFTKYDKDSETYVFSVNRDDITVME